MAKDFTQSIMDHKRRLERCVDGSIIRVLYSPEYSKGDTTRRFQAHLKVDFSRNPSVERFDVFITMQGIEMVNTGDLLFADIPEYKPERHMFPAVFGEIVLSNRLRRRTVQAPQIDEPTTGKEEFPCPR